MEKKTPSCPIVSLPLANEFNDVVTLDLKVWNKDKKYLFFTYD